MTIVQFTATDAPSRPVTINSDFVISLKPRRQVRPNANSQTPGAVITTFAGTEIRTADGLKYLVNEDYDEVNAKLFNTVIYASVTEENPRSWIPSSEESDDLRADFKKALQQDVAGLVSKDQVPSLADTDREFLNDLKAAGVPISDGIAASTSLHDLEDAAQQDLGVIAPEGDIDPSSEEAQLRREQSGITKYGDERSAPGGTEPVKAPPAKKAPAKKAAPKQPPASPPTGEEDEGTAGVTANV